MPYIKKEKREIIDKMDYSFSFSAGDYVYLIYKRMLKMWKESPCFETAYKIRNNLGGFVFDLPEQLKENMKKYNSFHLQMLAWEEFRRRILGPYEDEKLKENGDVEI